MIKRKIITIVAPGLPFDDDSDKIPLGGSETSALYMARALAGLGHWVTVFCNCGGVKKYSDNLCYRPLDQYKAYHSTVSIDVNIIQRSAAIAKIPTRARVNVLWSHDLFLYRENAQLLEALPNLKQIWPVSNWHKDQAETVTGLPPDAFWATRNGIDAETIQAGRATGSSERTVPRLYFPSRPERGLLECLDIMDEIWKTRPEIELSMGTYGSATEQNANIIQAAARRIEKSKGEGRSIIQGQRGKQDLYEEMASCDLLLYPSEFEETFCLSFLEAKACGLPVICTDGCGAGKNVYNGIKAVHGEAYVFASKDPRARAEQILGILASGPPRPEILNLDYYDWHTIAYEWDCQMEDLLGAGEPALARPAAAESAVVDVVVPTMVPSVDLYEILKHTESSTDSVLKFYVVNNGTPYTDGEMNNLKASLFSPVIIENNGTNRGITQAWNQGIRATTAPLVCILNDDAYLLRDSLGLLAQAVDGDTVAVSVNEHGRSDGVLSGCCMLFDGDWLRANPFDERFFLVYQDTDMQLKLALQNRKCSVVQGAGVVHLGSFVRRNLGAAHDNRYEEADWAEFIKKWGEHTAHSARPPLEAKEALFAMKAAKQLWFEPFLTDQWPEAVTLLRRLIPGELQLVAPASRLSLSQIFTAFESALQTGGSVKVAQNGDFVITLHEWVDLTGLQKFEPAAYTAIPRERLAVKILIGESTPYLSAALEAVEALAPDLLILGKTSGRGNIDPGLYEGLGVRTIIVECGNPLEEGFHTVRNRLVEAAENAGMDWLLTIDSDEILCHPEAVWPLIRTGMVRGYSIEQHHISNDPKPGLLETNKPVRLFRLNMGIRYYGWIHEHPEDECGKSIALAIAAGAAPSLIHYGYLTEGARRGRFRRNRTLVEIETNINGDKRELTQYFAIRDLVHEARYASEEGRFGERERALCVSAMEKFEQKFLAAGTQLTLMALPYCTEALRYLGAGIVFEYKIRVLVKGAMEAASVAGTDLFSSPETFLKFVGGFAVKANDIVEKYI